MSRALVIAGVLVALLAAGLGAGGGAALWAHDQKDAQGYLSSDDHRLSTASSALVSENLDLDLDGLESFVDESRLGSIRVEIDPRTDAPVFVGLARTSDVATYLDGVPHATVTDALDGTPGYHHTTGNRRVGAPADSPIWAASAVGAGPQTLTWDARDGDWSVVVMNADGTPRVDVELDAGAKLPWLDDLGWVLAGAALVAAALAALLVLLGVRGPRDPSGSPAPSPTPVTVA